MAKHEAFMNRLVALVHYAEENGLEVASLALVAAAEIIAPTLQDASSKNENVISFADYRQ